MTHTLYGAEISYYTGKVRAYFDWKGIPYEEKLADAHVYREIIVPRVGYPIIPVVITDEGECLQDTTEIIDWFEAREPEPSIYPAGPRQKLAALLLEVYGDEWLVLPAMHYRWNWDEEAMYPEFGRVSAPDAPEAEWTAIGKKRAGPFRGSLPFLGVTEETGPAIEASYRGLLAELDAHFAAHDYCFGSRPSMGDFGLIGPLYAHLYRDPKSGDFMRATAPHVARWVERLRHQTAPRAGAFLPGDEVPETLLPVLARMMREQVPVLQATADAFSAWSRAHDGEEIPRAIGMHEFTLEGVTGERAILPFNLWMFQRPRRFYQGLSEAERAAADSLLEAAGGAAFRDFRDGPALKRDNFKLVLGEPATPRASGP